MKDSYKKSTAKIKILILCLLIFVINTFIFVNTNFAIAQSNHNLPKNVYFNQSKDEFYKIYPKKEFIALSSPFGFDFLLHSNPDDFCIAGFENNRLVLYYTDSKYYKGIYQISIGSPASSVKSIKRPAVFEYTYMKGYAVYRDDRLGRDYDAFDMDGKYYLFVFYDRFTAHKTVNGIFMIDKRIWLDYLFDDDLFSKQKGIPNIDQSFEKITFYHLNSIRYNLHKDLLDYSSKANFAARLHSQNMAKYNFFGHTDIFGNEPSDRMKAQGISFKIAGENIAMGTKLLPFFANHLLLNSEGHRKNIEGSFKFAGIGVYIDGAKNDIYYTQNFFSP